MGSDNHKIADGIYRVGISDTILTDGVWRSNGDTGAYLVESQAKLASIPDAGPGDIAFTAGYQKMWQMDTDGTTWVAIN